VPPGNCSFGVRDRILGDRISGDRISGDPISGDRISGDRISGDRISGDRISGDRISGDQNRRSKFFQFQEVKSITKLFRKRPLGPSGVRIGVRLG
jgi:hypothetical protein